MLDEARRIGARRPVDWQQADALALPFPADSADVVVCQFGAMFFPEKAKAFAEACRVLAPGGAFVFSVWDRIEENEVADVVTNAMKSVFPEDPPWFMRRTPHGYFDRATIERDLSLGGFQGAIELETIAARSRATSASDVAVAICQGTPLRNEIEARDPTRLAVATEAATRALVERFGDGAIDAKMQAHVFVVRR
jgi:SAM-dependent methyltransferase